MTTTEIQQQIDEAFAAGGGEVVLPAGEHTLEAPLRLKPHVNLRGTGEQTLLTTEDVDTNFIELDPGADAAAHDIEISNLHLKGPGTSPGYYPGRVERFDERLRDPGRDAWQWEGGPQRLD